MGVELVEAPLAPAFAAEWRELADLVGAPPFLYPEWFAAWFEAFGGTQRGLAVRDGGELVAVLPLRYRRGVVRSPANWHTPVFGPVARDPAAAGELADSLLGLRARRLDLTMVAGDDPLLAALSDRAGRPTIRRLVARQPYVRLSEGLESFERGLSRKLRKELGRMERRLGEQGEVGFEFHDGSERLDELIEQGVALEGSGWKSERGTAISSRPETSAFYTGICRWAAIRGWLSLAFLTLDGRPVAFDLCLERGGSVYVLKGGFDPELRKWGPGTLLTWESLRRAFAAGMDYYEFLGTDQSYKLGWTDTVRERWRFQGFARSPGGVVELGAWRYGRPLAKRVLSRA